MLFNNKNAEDHMRDSASLNKAARPSSATSLAVNQPSSPTRSIIDACLVITGNLQSEREVQVDGEVHGDVHCSQLMVGKDGTINGNILAEAVVVRGKVKGVIRADRVMLQDTAHVESEIFHKSLVIEEGASFDGQSRRTEQPHDLHAMAADMKSAEKRNDKSSETERAA
jgi:cytoskeletal protein CcmA (bactofilin family)